MSEIPFKKIESDRGKPVIVVEDQKFSQAFIKKNGEIRCRCTVKSCSARVSTDESMRTNTKNYYQVKLAESSMFAF